MFFLAIDIGTSFIKSAVIDLQDMKVHRVRKNRTPVVDSLDSAVRELSVPEIVGILRLVIEANDRLYPLSGIVFSTQMHGAMIRDHAEAPAINYITWQDKRSQMTGADGYNSAERAVMLAGPKRMYQVGNRIGTGHTAAHMLAWKERTGRNPERISLLGDAVMEELCGHSVSIHETQACATGLYDLYQREWSRDMLCALGFENVSLPDVEKDGKPVGAYKTDHGRIPMYAAIGDQQAAMLGSFLDKNELMINVGTGAQVIWMGESSADNETRLLLDGDCFSTISGLPGGRSLNVLMRFFEDVGKELFDISEVNEGELWRRIIQLPVSQGCCLPKVQMTFGDAGGGEIVNINEDNLLVAQLMAGAYENMAGHFEEACRCLCVQLNNAKAVVMGGGVGRRLPRLRELMDERLGLPVRYAPYEEDVLVGLARISAYYAGIYQDIDRTNDLNGYLRFVED